MPSVLLSNDDVTVLGPPEVVELLVDIGPTGTRGSQIFVGLGNPNLVSIGQTPLLNDIYLNISGGDEYSYLYQYVSEPGGNTWIPVLKMNPVLYSKINSLSFTSGNATLTIAIADIANVTGTPLTADNFNIQYNLMSENPIASSIEVPTLVDPDYLVINFHAVKYSGSSWSNLSGAVKVNLFISIV
jgi:restriction endonuclease S subunit